MSSFRPSIGSAGMSRGVPEAIDAVGDRKTDVGARRRNELAETWAETA